MDFVTQLAVGLMTVAQNPGEAISEANLVLNEFGASEWLAIIITFLAALGSLGFGWWLITQIREADRGTPGMIKVNEAIMVGAKAYLYRQMKLLWMFVVGLAVVLLILYLPIKENKWAAIGVGLAFVLGSAASFAAGFVGMNLAVYANLRVAAAALKSFKRALELAFRAGAVSGVFTVGLGLLGACLVFALWQEYAIQVLVGFGFGGSLIALFMRGGGGIYTKAADVGADLVGKVEAGIPEDDPRNAATIADNVGDNVGDCAGMAADVFESYEVTLVAAILLGAFAQRAAMDHGGGVALDLGSALWTFPLIVRAVGVVASIIGVLMVKGDDKDKTMDPMKPINTGFTGSAVVAVLGILVATVLMMKTQQDGQTVIHWSFGIATIAGVALAMVIGRLTNYYTHTDEPPVTEIANSARTGPATIILSGLAAGMESSVWSILSIGGAVVFSFAVFGGDLALGSYGVALMGLGLLTTTGYILAMDTYGPIADNANGVFEMADDVDVESDPEASRIVARLDQVGNVTKALTKGFAIATAVIAAVSLFKSFVDEVGLEQIGIQVNHPLVFVGFLIGGAVPFLFSSIALNAVSRAAFQVVQEVRRQFREIPGIMEGENLPDYQRCVDIVTSTAQRELLGPGILAVTTPILTAFLLGSTLFGTSGLVEVEINGQIESAPLAGAALGAYLAGAILVGQLMAVFMSNAGGAWDNAKKKIEDGMFGGKGTDEHKAAVVGDTVGDPFKDTAGPALNPLIKVMNLVAILLAPVLAKVPGPEVSLMVSLVCIGLLGLAVWWSKRGASVIEDSPA